MRIMSGIAIAGLVLGALIMGSTESLGQGAECGNHLIQVSEGEGGVPVLRYHGGSAEEVHVCKGDTVRWVLNGPNREYLVDFFEGAPFAGDEKRRSHDNTVVVTIGDSAEGEYSYGVNFADGGGMDPKIIVD